MILPAYELHVEALAREPVSLAELAGSALRGAFGDALRAVSCATRAPTCIGCPLTASCTYPLIFESAGDRTETRYAQQTETPRRYVFAIDLGARTVAPGESFLFTLRIVGDVARHVPWVALALLEMGRQGIGKGRGCFRILTASIEGAENACVELIRNDVLLAVGEPCLPPIDALGALEQELQEPSESLDPGEITVRFLTPTYLRARDRDPFEAPELALVVRSALRRLSHLCELYGSRGLLLPYAELIEQAAQAHVASSSIAAFRRTRFSNRQGRSLPFEGIVGEVRYVSSPAWLPALMLRAGWLGIGKMATHGMGRVTV